MVKLNFWEELAIYVLVFIGTIFIPVDRENWIVAVLLIIVWLGVSSTILKLIRGKDKEESKKNKMSGNWWKKQKTWEKVIIILGAIVVGIMFFSWIFGSSKDSNFDMEKYAKENFDKLITEDLTDYGYEVLSVGIIGDTNYSFAYLNMKSLGSRSTQIWDGLLSLASHSKMAGYNNISHYTITILAPTNECTYTIQGETWKTYADNLGKPFDYDISIQLENNVNYEINKSKVCY